MDNRETRLAEIRARRKALEPKVNPIVMRITRAMIERYEDALRRLARS